jgi:ABC-type antimicrobial peptide transport system, ATPase component
MAVELRNVSKVYGNGSIKTVALDDVSLSVSPGEIVVLMGPSGSGKTTMLNIIATLDKPTSGEVRVLGVDVVRLPESRLERFRLRHVGYLFQSYNLVPYLTAEQNVALPLIALGVRKELAVLRARVLLELVGLEKAASLYPHQMSGGMQQRAALARALATNPPLLILDEPTSNIDLENASLVLGLIYVVNRLLKTTVFIATHDPDVTRIATRVVYMRGGKIYETAEPPRRELKIDLDRAAAVYEKLKHIDELIGL